MITEKEVKAALLDRSWIFVLPTSTDKDMLTEHSVINSMLVSMLNEHFKVPTCHAALVDANGHVHPGFFIWDPKPATIENILRSDPLVTLTPLELRARGKDPVTPDHSTLCVSVTDNKDIITLGLEERVRKATRQDSPFYVDGMWRNCFFLIPKPFPTAQVLTEKVETLANIRNIDMEEAWPILLQESKAGQFTPRTERVRRLFLEVCVAAAPSAAEFGFYYNDKEGNRV